MSVEIEAKLQVQDLAPTRAKLIELGAAPHGKFLEVNTFFDTEDRSLLASEKGLRVRLNHNLDTDVKQGIVTFKGPRRPGQFKSREEIETEVSSPEAADALLKALGFVRVLSFEKKRESWDIADCRVELDELPHLGFFVEIEGPNEKIISDLQARLGLEKAPAVKASYVGMLIMWLQERSNSERTVTFPKKPTK